MMDRSAIMRAVKSIDTGPELIVRRLAHALGYRFRLHRRDLPGCPDLVFPSKKKALFVHGCFWHGHNCARGSRVPKTNRDYWVRKVQWNKERDAKHTKTLAASDWKVLVVWECETKKTGLLMRRLKRFLGETKKTQKSPSLW